MEKYIEVGPIKCYDLDGNVYERHENLLVSIPTSKDYFQQVHGAALCAKDLGLFFPSSAVLANVYVSLARRIDEPEVRSFFDALSISVLEGHAKGVVLPFSGNSVVRFSPVNNRNFVLDNGIEVFEGPYKVTVVHYPTKDEVSRAFSFNRRGEEINLENRRCVLDLDLAQGLKYTKDGWSGGEHNLEEVLGDPFMNQLFRSLTGLRNPNDIMELTNALNKEFSFENGDIYTPDWDGSGYFAKGSGEKAVLFGFGYKNLLKLSLETAHPQRFHLFRK